MDAAGSSASRLLEAWRGEAAALRRTLVEQTRGAIAAAGAPRVALGLSGGLDSAVAAHLCVEAIGAENVLALLLPVRTTDPASLSIAQGVVNQLGITTRRVNLSAVADAYFANFPDASRQRRGSCVSWLRTGVMLDLAATYGATIVQAINRSDRLLGYGDGPHELVISVRPLADVYKSQVRMLAEELEVLSEVRRRRPSLEQWAGQSDETDLGHPYEVLDPLLEDLQSGTSTEDAVRLGYPQAAVTLAADRLARARARFAAPAPVAVLGLRNLPAALSSPPTAA
jgi:NAD+ synthase